MEKARQQHLQNARERQSKRLLDKEEYNKKVQELEQQHIKYLEDKIVKKALAIKRRTIIEDAYINKVIEIDDVPLDTLSNLVKKHKQSGNIKQKIQSQYLNLCRKYI